MWGSTPGRPHFLASEEIYPKLLELGISLRVERLRVLLPQTGGQDSIPEQRTLSHMPQLKITCAFESVLMRWMKLEPITQSEVSQKEKLQYGILTHIYGI